MDRNVYVINRGINKPPEFGGLIGQYIYYGAGMVLGGLVLFAIGYALHINPWIGLLLAAGLAGSGLARVYYLSAHYGAYGMLKKRALRRLPRTIRCRTRKIFITVKN